MKLLSRLVYCTLLLLAACRGQVQDKPVPDKSATSNPPTLSAGAFRLSGPYTHKNLSIYLVHGKETLPGATYLTLEEAMRDGRIKVHETGNVNELAVENLSDGQDIFIQAGDIVRGGQQDRVLAVDLIVPPKSGRLPIAAFCVEHGRWRGRGGESVATFGSSMNCTNSAPVLLAIKGAGDQSVVWSSVNGEQQALSMNLGTDVRSAASASSYQLTLENKDVQASADEYVAALGKLVDEHADAIGYVAAIEGKLGTADVYGSRALFLKFWPRLLQGSAVAALSAPANSPSQARGQGEGATTAGGQASSVGQHPDAAEPPAVATLEQAHAFLLSAEDAQPSEQSVPPRARLVTRKGQAGTMFETFDREKKSGWVHRNCVKAPA